MPKIAFVTIFFYLSGSTIIHRNLHLTTAKFWATAIADAQRKCSPRPLSIQPPIFGTQLRTVCNSSGCRPSVAVHQQRCERLDRTEAAGLRALRSWA